MGTHGLTLGKYAPLHKGHQLVIETALRETDRVTAIIYDAANITPVPLPTRSNWLRTLYPQLQIIEAWDSPEKVGDTPEIKKQHEDYIQNRLNISGITHFYSSEFYGDHMSRALGAVNREVDAARAIVPISATRIRENPFAHRAYLHPMVYRDLLVNVLFLGAPSTGKTTIAQRMAAECNTTWMPEYGREYWEQNQVDRRLTGEQLVEIAEEHAKRELELSYQADRFFFIDTNALTTLSFSYYYHSTATPRLLEIADRTQSVYDIVFLCDTDIPYEDTWDRSGDVNRLAFQNQIRQELLARRIPFLTLRGDLLTRVKTVHSILRVFQKHKSMPDSFIQQS